MATLVAGVLDCGVKKKCGPTSVRSGIPEIHLPVTHAVWYLSPSFGDTPQRNFPERHLSDILRKSLQRHTTTLYKIPPETHPRETLQKSSL